MKILVEGWLYVPHSYAIVNVFQLYALHLYFPDITVFVNQPPYANPNWKSLEQSTRLLYPLHIQQFLSTIRVHNGEPVDIIYRIAYPYNILPHATTLTVVFYTCEFGTIGLESIVPRVSCDELLHATLDYYTNLHFITPSAWSHQGLAPFTTRNTIIPHGVDCDIFFRKPRSHSGKITFLHAGAMTRNKGTFETLFLLFHLVMIHRKNYKLILKCSDALYGSSRTIDAYMNELVKRYEIDTCLAREFIDSHVTIIGEILSFEQMNDLYNQADVYIAPYSAEGFNLIPLEALSAGLKLVVTDRGSTEDFVSKMPNVIQLPSSPCVIPTGRCNNVQLQNALNLLLACSTDLETPMDDTTYNTIRRVIQENYTWKRVVESYVAHFKTLV